MGLHLVTGRSGFEHITPSDHGAFHNALLISGSYVLNTGNKLAASVITNNSIRISDGEFIMQGRHVRLAPGEIVNVTIANGAQDYKRNDLIVARYIKDGTTGVESVNFVVIQGTPGTTATDPAYINGNILNGALTADFPLYRVPLEGLSVGKLVPLFEMKDNFDKRINDIVNGTTKVPKAAAADTATRATNDANGKDISGTYETKENVQKILAGIESGETATGNAAALGGETATQWQTKIDNIQTTSRATLSTAGWYRVAEYSNISVPNLKGSNGNSCKIELKRTYTTVENESIGLILSSKANEQEFNTSYAISNATKHLLTKVRYTHDSAKAYIEIYYSGTTNNSVFVSITDCSDISSTWQAITPTLTSETVDGVTVTTTYDIPANASPVTDLDVGYLEKYKTFDSSWTKIKDANLGLYMLTGAKANVSDLPPGANTSISNMLWVLVFKLTDQNAYLAFEPQSNKAWFGQNYGGDISWHTIATTADLANYLPKTGGTIDGITTVKAENWIPFRVTNTDSNTACVQFNGKDGALGYLGVSEDKPRFVNANGSTSYDLLHSGNYTDYTVSKANGGTFDKNVHVNAQLSANIGEFGQLRCSGGNVLHTSISAAVKIQESAPTDTSALWVW